MTNARNKVLATALELAAKHRYDRLTRGMVASAAGVATGSVNYYFTDMDGLRDALMAEAVATGHSEVVAQGLVDRHPAVMAAPADVRAAALASLGG